MHAKVPSVSEIGGFASARAGKPPDSCLRISGKSSTCLKCLIISPSGISPPAMERTRRYKPSVSWQRGSRIAPADANRPFFDSRKRLATGKASSRQTPATVRPSRRALHGRRYQIAGSSAHSVAPGCHLPCNRGLFSPIEPSSKSEKATPQQITGRSAADPSRRNRRSQARRPRPAHPRSSTAESCTRPRSARLRTPCSQARTPSRRTPRYAADQRP